MFVSFLKTHNRAYLAGAVIAAVAGYMFKLEGLVIIFVLAATYAIYAVSRLWRSRTDWHAYVDVGRDLLLLAISVIPYALLKYAKKNFGDRDLVLTGQKLKNLLNPDIISVYPKTIAEQYTLLVAVIAVIGLLYMLFKKRDHFAAVALASFAIIVPLATSDGTYFLGADFGRYVAGVGIGVAGCAALFLAEMLKKSSKHTVHALAALGVICGYMLLNAFSPLSFEQQSYHDGLPYTHKHRPFEQNSRFLPSRELAEAMRDNGVTGQQILKLTYFPHASYDRVFALGNEYIDLRDEYFNIPTEQQNPQTLRAYVKARNISLVIAPMLQSDNVREWWYSCAFAALEFGDNPSVIPLIAAEQKEFKTVLFVENRHGSLYLLRPSTQQ